MTIAIAQTPATKRRIWSEFVSYPELKSARVMRLLGQAELEVLVAVMPENLPEISDLCRCYSDAGIPIGVWPMLADKDGRWASTYNAQCYASFVSQLCAKIPFVQTIAIDLEPPIDMLRGLLHGKASAYRRLFRSATWQSGQQILRDLLQTLKEQGFHTIAAANPMLLSDREGESAWQWLFGTPIEDLPFDAISFMTYTSLLEGYGRGLVNREFARSILVQSAASATRRLGTRASISIGSVGGGALGDERPYRNAEELVDDVGLVRACGIRDIALFDLSGVLKRPNPEQWISAFVSTQASTDIPRESKRTRTLKAGIKSGGRVVARYRRLRGLACRRQR